MKTKTKSKFKWTSEQYDDTGRRWYTMTVNFPALKSYECLVDPCDDQDVNSSWLWTVNSLVQQDGTSHAIDLIVGEGECRSLEAAMRRCEAAVERDVAKSIKQLQTWSKRK